MKKHKHYQKTQLPLIIVLRVQKNPKSQNRVQNWQYTSAETYSTKLHIQKAIKISVAVRLLAHSQHLLLLSLFLLLSNI